MYFCIIERHKQKVKEYKQQLAEEKKKIQEHEKKLITELNNRYIIIFLKLF